MQYEALQRVTPAHPCPVCGHTGWCNFTSTMVHCMRSTAPAVGEWVFRKKARDGGSIYVRTGSDVPRRDPVLERPVQKAPSNLAPVAVRDRWYRQVIRSLGLSDQHRENLHRRGLRDEHIVAREYRTLPQFSPRARGEFTDRLLEIIGQEPKGVPGFFRSKSGKWYLAGGGGMLIPVRDLEGRIQAFQIRLDALGTEWILRKTMSQRTIEDDGPYKGQVWGVVECQTPDGEVKEVWVTTDSLQKQVARLQPGDILCGMFKKWPDGRVVFSRPNRYIWLTSATRPEGCSPSTPIHVTAPVGSRCYHPGVVWLTEGPLKADVAAQYQRDRFIAVPGVSIRQGVVEVLQALNARWVVLAFDMDGRTNPHVRRHTQAMIEHLVSAGFKVALAEWDAGYDPESETYRFKGIDDALSAGVPVRVKVVEEVRKEVV